ncbi:MAG TPA: type II secretion system F family protein [Bryobacteraceae bacterium]|nr:type II secretion system F family protein [Bryobacteraceae bacterium]
MALVSIGLFCITFLIAFPLLRRSMRGADAVLERLLAAQKPAARDSKPIARLHRVVAWIGSRERARTQEQLRRSFIQAGIRSPRAANILRGLKTLAALAGGISVATVMMLQKAEGSRVVMGAMAGIGCGYMLPDELLKMKIRRRRARIAKALPNTLDLMTICVEAGLGLDQAIVQVSKELAATYPEISSELAMISLELRAGKRRADCLRAFAERTGIGEVKKLAAILIQADRFGTSIAQSLRIHSEHLRTQRRQQAEEKAAKLGVKLVFPIFFFILPSLFVITVGPVIVRIFRDLLPMLNSL